jgi:ribonuclease I
VLVYLPVDSTQYGVDVNPQTVQKFWNDLLTYWPNEQEPSPSSPYLKTLWDHEWGKHGTCAGGDQNNYFGQVLHTVYPQVPTPQVLMNNIGGSVQKSVSSLAPFSSLP